MEARNLKYLIYPSKGANKTVNVSLWLLCIHGGTDVKEILKKNSNSGMKTPILSNLLLSYRSLRRENY